MESQEHRERGSDVLKRYRSLGLWGGLVLGAIGGMMVSGPYLHEWPFAASAAVVLGGSAGLALIGWLFGALVPASIGAGEGHGAMDPHGHADGALHHEGTGDGVD